MLKYSEILIADDEDSIIKAISWVLREAAKYDPHPVRDLLIQHQDRLAARIKREVTKKGVIGLKNLSNIQPVYKYYTKLLLINFKSLADMLISLHLLAHFRIRLP
jgi:hypothetical protein